MKTAMRKAMQIMLAGLLVGLLAGCAPRMPRADARFGQEVRALLAAQALPGTEQIEQPGQSGQPEAGARMLPALDGTAARAALTAYQRHAATARPGSGNGGIAGGAGIAGGSAR
jgi:hypothetical protein